MGVFANNKISLTPPAPGGNIPWPITTRLGIFTKVLKQPGDQIDADTFKLSIVYNDEHVLQNISGPVNFSPGKGIMTIFFVNPVFKFPGPGKIHCTLLIEKQGSALVHLSPDTALEIEEAISAGLKH